MKTKEERLTEIILIMMGIGCVIAIILLLTIDMGEYPHKHQQNKTNITTEIQ